MTQRHPTVPLPRPPRESVRVLAVVETAAGADVRLLRGAFARVARAHPQTELVLVDASDRGEMLEEMQRAHVFVAARQEAAPYAVPPALPVAMVGGLCVIASDVGGIGRILTDGFDGLLVAPGDERALAAALTRVITDHEERRRLGETAATSIRGALKSA